MRALISVGWPDGSAQLAIVPMDTAETAIDRSFWKPLGMESSDSFAVDFSGVFLTDGDLLGRPGAYQESPWFTAGASRFVAVQTGGVERLVNDFGAFLRRREQHDDPIQLTRFGECAVAARSARACGRRRAWMPGSRTTHRPCRRIATICSSPRTPRAA